MKTSSGKDQITGKTWLLSGMFSMVMLSLFWSVDESVIYFCLGIAAFCFFQYFSLEFKFQRKEKPIDFRNQPPRPSHRIDDVLEEIQKGFASTGRNDTFRTFVQRAFGFVIVFIIVVVIGVIFSDDVLEESANYLRGAEFTDRGEYDSAAYYCRLASLDAPDDPEVYLGWGNALMNLNRYDSAILLYDQTLALDEYHRMPGITKGILFINRKSTEKQLVQLPESWSIIHQIKMPCY